MIFYLSKKLIQFLMVNNQLIQYINQNTQHDFKVLGVFSTLVPAIAWLFNLNQLLKLLSSNFKFNHKFITNHFIA